MQFIYEYGLFFAKSATVVFAIILIIAAVVRAKQRHPEQAPGEIDVRNLSDEYEDLVDTMKINLLDEDEYKEQLKAEQRKEKEEEKLRKKQRKALKKEQAKNPEAAESEDETDERKPRLFVLDFDGDMEASAVHCLREEITAIISIAEKQDGVLLRLESPGGMVHSYGHASSQLQRLRDAGIDLTIAVDEIAASGGYMMACVANKIISAPFAVIGSIGVVAEIPNFHRLLKKLDVDYEQHTAGQFKRTLTVFGENTEEGRKKFQQELEDTHALFKQFVAHYRPQLSLDQVATGEHWYGSQALEMSLVDELQTSDAYLQDHYESHDVYAISYEFRQTWADKLTLALHTGLDRFASTWLQRSAQRHNYFR